MADNEESKQDERKNTMERMSGDEEDINLFLDLIKDKDGVK